MASQWKKKMMKLIIDRNLCIRIFQSFFNTDKQIVAVNHYDWLSTAWWFMGMGFTRIIKLVARCEKQKNLQEKQLTSCWFKVAFERVQVSTEYQLMERDLDRWYGSSDIFKSIWINVLPDGKVNVRVFFYYKASLKFLYLYTIRCL